MCTGVDNGLAGRKFSGSPKRYGVSKHKVTNDEIVIRNPIVSLIEK